MSTYGGQVSKPQTCEQIGPREKKKTLERKGIGRQDRDLEADIPVQLRRWPWQFPSPPAPPALVHEGKRDGAGSGCSFPLSPPSPIFPADPTAAALLRTEGERRSSSKDTARRQRQAADLLHLPRSCTPHRDWSCSSPARIRRLCVHTVVDGE